MSDSKTKKPGELPVAAALSGNDKIMIVGADGNGKQASVPAIGNALIESSSMREKLLGNVFIVYHHKSDNFPLMVKPHKWTSLQNSGEIADGVAVVEGGKVLVVAPTEADSAGLLWSSAAVAGGATTTSDRVAAMNDWNGKANTASIIAASTSAAVTNTAAYAPGFCSLYSRANANGHGLTAGKWWLPSMGEMMMICTNMTKINYCLSLISGATQIAATRYWTSTESGIATAWMISSSNFYCNLGNAKDTRSRVRPISTLII